MEYAEIRRMVAKTQEEFAEMIGVSRSTVAMWETGENIPSLENLKRISQITGLTIDEIVN